MTKLELRNQIRTNELEIAKISDLLEVEKRKASAVENITIENLKADNKELQKELEKVEVQEARNATVITNGQKEERFSLLKAVREVAEGRMDYLTHPTIKAGMEEMRKSGFGYTGQIVLPVGTEEVETRTGINAGTTNYGAEIVQITKFNLLGALRACTVLADAGATFLTGLVNNGSTPIYAGSSAAWASETGASTAGASTFSKVDISPKRITTYIDISKRFLLQDSIGAEALLVADIQKAIMVLLEATILGTAAGTATQPAGVFYNTTFTAGGTNGNLISGTTTWANVVGLESYVLTQNKPINMATAAYLVHPSINGVMKTTAKASNQAIFIKDVNGAVNGYKTLVTSNMPSLGSSTKATMFADFSDLVIGQWGGIDLTVDPYSQAVNGNIRIIANVYFDAAWRRTVSYALAALK